MDHKKIYPDWPQDDFDAWLNKFMERNAGSFSILDELLEKDKKIKALLVSPGLHRFLAFHEDSQAMCMEVCDEYEPFTYKGCAVIMDSTIPEDRVYLLRKLGNGTIFEVPCICNIYPGEQHP